VVAEWLPPTLVTLLGQEEDCLQQQKLPLVSGATYQGAGSLNFFKHYYSVYLELVAANKFIYKLLSVIRNENFFADFCSFYLSKTYL